MTPLLMRQATETDLPFVYDNWRKSYRDSDFGYTLTGDVYFELQKAKMQSAIETSRVHIACLPADHDHLLGFVVHNKRPDDLTVVHYLYVKWQYRNAGVAKRMLAYIKPSVPVVWTDITEKFLDIREAKDLPYVTARELEDFTNTAQRNGLEPMQVFSKWFRDQVIVNQRRRTDETSYKTWRAKTNSENE